MGGHAVLLARRDGSHRGAQESFQGLAGHFLVTVQVGDKLLPVEAGVAIEARTVIRSRADHPGAYLVAVVEYVIHRGEVVHLHADAMSRDGMSHLARGFQPELRRLASMRPKSAMSGALVRSCCCLIRPFTNSPAAAALLLSSATRSSQRSRMPAPICATSSLLRKRSTSVRSGFFLSIPWRIRLPLPRRLPPPLLGIFRCRGGVWTADESASGCAQQGLRLWQRRKLIVTYGAFETL